jgi:hypothetical protein
MIIYFESKKMKKYFFVFIVNLIVAFNFAHSQIVINEVCPFNAVSAFDEDTESPDWIELYNKGTEPVNLKDYRIYDKNEYGKAWILPDTIIQPGDYLIVFCDEQNKIFNTNFIIEATGHGIATHNASDGMRYLYLPVSGDFDMSLSIKAMRNYKFDTRAALMFREKLEDGSRYASVITENPDRKGIRLHYRVVENENPSVKYYWNKEFDFFNDKLRLQKVGDTIHSYIWDDDYYWYTKETSCYLPTQNNSGFIGIAFASANNSVLSNLVVSDLFLNGDKKDFADMNVIEFHTTIEGKSYYSRELHSNFKLAREGETVYLWDDKGNLINQLEYKYLNSDNTYGRYPSGTDNLEFFKKGTAAKTNESGFKGILPTPELSIQQGFYNEQVSVSINCEDKSAKIFYTLNGDDPDKESMIWNGTPLQIKTSTAIRARAFRDEYIESQIMNESIFIKDSTTFDVISFFTDPDNLYDKDNGLFQEKNLYEDIIIPCHFQLWGKDKLFKYESPCGAKLHGQVSKRFSQKPLRIYAKAKFNATEFNYPFFGDEGLKKYERLLLRNGGTDWTKTIYRDGFASILSQQIPSLDAMGFSPAVMFLNGKFYGIQNIRERIDETYISLKYNIPERSINLLEDWEKLMYGSSAKFMMMRDSIMKMDMSESNAYSFLDRNIDLNNLMDYVIFESFLANIDWPWKNLKFWQSDSLDGKWRWILNDLDYICGVGSFTDFSMFILLNDSTQRFNDWFNRVLENETFRNNILNRNADLVNTVFLPDNTLKLADSMFALFAPEIPRQHAKYDSSAKEWDKWATALKDFLKGRPKLYMKHWVKRFNLTDTSSVYLNVNPPDAGKIQISTITPQAYPWHGVYFQDVPVTINAIPNKGYSFKDWSVSKYAGDNITIYLPSSLDLTANFLKNSDKDTILVINEIMYKNHNSFDSDDWFELYNKGNTTLDMEKWIFKDNDDAHIFEFPSAVIKPDEYLVVCRDTVKFKEKYPEVVNIVGNFDFGLGEKDIVRIFEPNSFLHDSVSYTNSNPWPSNADGTGSSIELMFPNIDNNIGTNWKSSVILYGTPGAVNSVSVDSSEPVINSKGFSNYPNPFSDFTTLEIISEDNSFADLTLYDSLGEKVWSHHNKELYKGNNRFFFVSDNLPNGSYYFVLNLHNEKEKKVLPIIIYRE